MRLCRHFRSNADSCYWGCKSNLCGADLEGGGASNLTGADRGRMWIGAVSPASRGVARGKCMWKQVR